MEMVVVEMMMVEMIDDGDGDDGCNEGANVDMRWW